MATCDSATGSRQCCCSKRNATAVPDFLERLLSARFVVAVLSFMTICALAATLSLGKRPSQQFSEHNWASWAFQDFLTVREKPQVVFLGSSLVLVPVAGVDANFLNRRLDGSQHHRSFYFEQRFKEATGAPVRTFNLALPGEMPSDAYLMTDFLLDGEKKPDILIYGVGPRDFMDNILPSPASTDAFHSLARLGDVSRLLDRVMPEWTDKLNFKLGRTFYLYGKKEDLSVAASRLSSSVLARLAPVPPGKSAFTVEQRRQLMPLYHPCELTAGDAFFRPSRSEQSIDNLAEYRKRYATVRWDTFATQMRFFTELLDVARQREIHVVVVSMPVTDINRSLIADYAWLAYRQSVHVLATLKGATFIDLQGSGAFKTADFMDTVHLHSGGGKKMLDIIVDTLAQRASCALSAKPDVQKLCNSTQAL